MKMIRQKGIYARMALVLKSVSILFMLVITGCSLPKGPGFLPTQIGQLSPTSTAPLSFATETQSLPVVDTGLPLPPQVIEISPQKGQELPLDGKIKLVFDQDMDQTATEQAWQMTDSSGKAVPGKITWLSARSLQFEPDQPLVADTTYLAVLSDQAASASGVKFLDPLKYEFTTVTNLQVSQEFPADKATEVENTAVITVIFNRPVTPLVIAEQQEDLPNPMRITPAVPGKGEWVSTSVYVYRPETVLAGATTYTVTVKSGLKDVTGEVVLPEDYNWSFATMAPGVDSFWMNGYPWDVNPQNGRANIPLNQGFTIKFRQPMDQASSESALSIKDGAGEKVPLDVTWDKLSTTMVFTPTQMMSLGKDYTLALDSAAQAQNGGSIKQGIRWNFTTVLPPAIESTDPAGDSVQSPFSPQFTIYFDSPMRFDTLKDKVVFTPSLEGDWQWYYGDYGIYGNAWTMYTYGLQPSTTYTVKILPGMEDLYGNQISRGQTIQFKTSAYTPMVNLQLPSEGPVIYRVGGPQDFYVSSRNIKNVTASIYQLPAKQFASMQLYYGEASPWSYNPVPEDLVWKSDESINGKLNERVLTDFNPQPNGEPLKPGFYILTLESPQVPHPGNNFNDVRLVAVVSTNLSFKTTDSEALVWVTDLTSGDPVQGAPVTIYNTQFEPVGTGISDADGLVYVNDLVKGSEWYDTFFALSDDLQSYGFASANWSSGVSPYDFGIWQDYYAQPDRPTAYIYTDRPLYRPGQPVYFKGIVRVDDDLNFSLPKPSEVNVTIESFEETVYSKTLPLSSFGSFEDELPLADEAALGTYTIRVRLPGKEDYIGEVSFNVAEYRKPEFIVDVAAEPKNVLPGEIMTMTIQADYYAGGGLANAEIKWGILTAPFYFTPSDEFAAYNFMDYEADTGYYNQENTTGGSEYVADGTTQTDDKGHAVVTLPADLGSTKQSQQFTFEAVVTDFAGTVVAGRDSLVVHTSAVYPGVRSKAYVGEIGKEQNFEIVALDWNSRPIPDQVVNVEVVERRWYSVQEQDANGRVTWSSSVQEIPVTSFSDLVLDDNGYGQISFTPQVGGVYRVKVSAADPRENIGKTSAFIWVAGEDYVPWRQSSDRSMTLVTDKKRYVPGETSEIMIASPFQGENYALVTVERGHIRQYEIVLMKTNSTIYKLPITPDMAPNAYVSVVVIKGADDGSPPDFRMGFIELTVDRKEQELNVEIIPDKEISSPGGRVDYTVRVSDYLSKPVSAEISLGLSDLAALNLSGPNSQSILDFFYYERGLGVWTAVPIVYTVEDYNAKLTQDIVPGGEAMGAGGGKGEGEEGVIQARGYFPDTAFWEAQLVTDVNGEAKVSITLPDNLTTWRMDARAVTKATLVGQSTQDIQSTKPLLVRPQTPRFFTVGDEVNLGTAVHNNTDTDLSVKVSLQAEGINLVSDPEQTVEIPARQQVLVTWKALVPSDSQRVDLVFQAEGGAYSDASRPTLGTLDNQGIPVYRYDAQETVGTSGQMLEAGTRVEGISLPPSMDVQNGELLIEVSPSLAAGMQSGLTYLESYKYECIEQTVSRFLPNVMTMQALKKVGLSNPELEAQLDTQINTALQKLYNLQNPDGGWGWWSNDKSDPLTSAYVILGMDQAKEAGFSVDQTVLNRGIAYLKTQVRSMSDRAQPYQLNRQAFILFVLAKVGSPQVSATVKLYDQRESMAYYARAFLAQTLYMIDSNDPRLQTLLSDFANAAILSSSGTHWEEEEADYWNWNTDTRTTAIILDAMSQLDSANPLNANAARWLMSNRTDGHWIGTQETAWTIMGLTDWMIASGELSADYTYGVAFNDQPVGEGQANQETLLQTTKLSIDINQMLKDEVNRLVISREAGPGNLYYTAFLNVDLPVDQIQALDGGILVKRDYFLMDDASKPITQAEQGQLVLVRLTVVAPHSLHYVVVNDPLPAGLEAVDQSLETNPQGPAPNQINWDDLIYKGWGWWLFDHIQYHDERVELSAVELPPGTYVYSYLARASSIGSFKVVPPTANEFYFPDVYGRGAGSQFQVLP
jgi:uncharacterized protein YfaS (alpha-2-macroglobulin family)